MLASEKGFVMTDKIIPASIGSAKLVSAKLVAARLLMALIFLLSGIGKISAYAGTQGYMAAMGVPGMLLTPAIIFEIGGAILLLLGFKTRILSYLMAGFCLLTATIFHADFADQIQMIMFLKNIAMAGGFIALGTVGAGAWSMDGRLAARAA